MQKILIIDDDKNMRFVLAAMVEREGYRATLAEDGKDGLQKFLDDTPDVVITDLRMPGMDGLQVLDRFQKENPEIPVILITAHGTVESAVTALKRGAFDFLSKPFDDQELSNILKKASATRLRARQDARTAALNDSGRTIVGEDPKIEEIYDVIGRVAASPSSILITGETGTGKELVAREIHRFSNRKDGSFIKINCAAIPEALMESELFGYERGAFTGAVTSKPGRFELADGGTLFLDEVGTLTLDMQVKLLQALQDGSFERVGGIKTIHIDVRLVAATNQNLESDIAAGKFREDLFYRLNVIPIYLPALRERTADVPLLAKHFISAFNKKLARSILGFSPEALHALSSYHWPGNIRELENVVERGMLLSREDVLQFSDLTENIRQAVGVDSQQVLAAEQSLKNTVKQATRKLERDMIRDALERTNGNVTHAARQLGISRKGLQLKMKELGFRESPARNDS